jgi:hypothetical protein
MRPADGEHLPDNLRWDAHGPSNHDRRQISGMNPRPDRSWLDVKDLGDFRNPKEAVWQKRVQICHAPL